LRKVAAEKFFLQEFEAHLKKFVKSINGHF